MATCRMCSLYRPGLNARGICPSCVRFHGENCLPPPPQRRAASRPFAGRSQPRRVIDVDDACSFEDLFQSQTVRQHAVQPAQPGTPGDTPARTSQDPLQVLQHILPRMKVREPAEQQVQPVHPELKSTPRPDPERLLALARDGKMSIEQLDIVLNASSHYGLSRKECLLLRDCQMHQLQQRGPRLQSSPLITHSQGSWWSLER